MLTEAPVSGGFVDPITIIKNALGHRYEIVSEIGVGGMATVYKAVQNNLERVVALKVLLHQYTYDKEFLERFHLEARTAAKLRHPNIITIFDEGVENGVHYIAMELLEGNDLHNIVKKSGTISPENIVKVIIPISTALDFAHKQGIVHRDVKSANIFVTQDKRAILTDFGIAHAAKGPKLTVGGGILGTPEFMSPEQADGKPIDGRIDIYALGVVMYFALTGEFPYSGENPVTTIYKIIHEPYTPISQINKNLPLWLERAVEGCLEKDVSRRIQSGRELAEILKERRVLPKSTPVFQNPNLGTIKITKLPPEPLVVKQQVRPPLPPEPPVVKPPVRPPLPPAGPKKKKEITAAERERRLKKIFGFLIVVIATGLIYLLIPLTQLPQQPETKFQTTEEAEQQPINPQNISTDDGRSNQNTQQQNTPPPNMQKKEKEPVPINEERVTGTQTVPYLIGGTEFTAKRLIQAAGLRVGVISYEERSESDRGRVLRQIPRAGRSLSAGEQVGFVVGR